MSKTVKIILIAVVVLIGLAFLAAAVATTAALAYGVIKVKPALTDVFKAPQPEQSYQLVSPQFQSSADQEDAGLLIASVQADSPAADAGLVRGDILLEFEEVEVNTFAELAQALAEYSPGDSVELSILHGDDQKTLTAQLADRDGRPYLGIAPCGCAMERDLSLTTMPRLGFIVGEVLPGGPAEEAGLEAGDHIVKLDDQELERGANLAELIAAMEPGDIITLEVIKPGQEARQLTITLGEHPDKEGVAYLGVRIIPAPLFRPQLEGIMPPDGAFPDLPGEDFVHPFDDEHFEMPEGFHLGVFIAEVIPDTPAAEADLQQGDIITAVEGQEVSTPEQVTEEIQSRQPGDEISLTIQRSGQEESLTVKVVLGEHPELNDVAFLGVNLSQVNHFEFHQDGEMPEGLPFFEQFFERLPSIELPSAGGEL